MTKRDSRTPENLPECGPTTASPRTDDRLELVQSDQPGSPPTEESEAEMYEPATRMLLKGDAYRAVGNKPHEGDSGQEPAAGAGKNDPSEGSTTRGRKDGGQDRKRPKG
ncbi:MAG: hypothetical protein LPJ87_08240 [Zoogloeaceae bacterium]|nr:hypothetical protein [Zoogloeaceae bacterium]